MNCDGALEVLFLIVDDEIEPDLSSAFKDHIAHCPPCARRAVYVRKLVAVVRERCARQTAPDRLRLKILHSFAHRQDSDPPFS